MSIFLLETVPPLYHVFLLICFFSLLIDLQLQDEMYNYLLSSFYGLFDLCKTIYYDYYFKTEEVFPKMGWVDLT